MRLSPSVHGGFLGLTKLLCFCRIRLYDIATKLSFGESVRPQTIPSLLSSLVIAMSATCAAHAADATPPIAAKTAWQETRHGEVVTDDYRWLQKKEDPNVISYLNAENAYTAAVTAPIEPLADKLFA